jgi:glycosyltransferase involved in cell wall biosynthesis
MCISDSMAESYGVRYHRVFEVLPPCCDAEAYVGLSPTRAVSPSVLSLVYSGSLYLGRPRVLAIVVSALELLRERGVLVQLDIYASHVPDDVRLLLERTDTAILHGAAEDTVAQSLLRGADVLLMVEGFERRNTEMTRLSLSSKIPFYLLANRPILVVGPVTSGTVRDAQSRGWGTVVTDVSAEAVAVAVLSAATPLNGSDLAEGQRRRMDALAYYSVDRTRSQVTQWLSVDVALQSRTDSV